LGFYSLVVAPNGVKFGTEEGMPNITVIGATCRPCGAKNLKISLLSKLNTGGLRCAQRCR